MDELPLMSRIYRTIQELQKGLAIMDYSDRSGDFIITYTGGRFYPMDPREEDINIEDIAHSLALINRFTGHTKFPYSVAQHCYWASVLTPAEHKLAALLHDASEAYVNDIARPVKVNLPDYQAVEDHIQEIICKKFGVDVFHPEVKKADNIMLVTEARVLCNGEGWWNDDRYPPPADLPIDPWDWQYAEDLYIKRFEELGGFDV